MNTFIDLLKPEVMNTDGLQLESCPFCGCTDIKIIKFYEWTVAFHGENAFIKAQCQRCGASTMGIPTAHIYNGEQDEMVQRMVQQRWNRRVDV